MGHDVNDHRDKVPNQARGRLRLAKVSGKAVSVLRCVGLGPHFVSKLSSGLDKLKLSARRSRVGREERSTQTRSLSTRNENARILNRMIPVYFSLSACLRFSEPEKWDMLVRGGPLSSTLFLCVLLGHSMGKSGPFSSFLGLMKRVYGRAQLWVS